MNILLLIREESSNNNINNYIRAIELYNGNVIKIKDNIDTNCLLKILENIDGILLTGGDKVGRLDYFLIKYAIDNNLKLLGICQGMQSMALYGSEDSLVEIGNLSHNKYKNYCHNVKLTNSKLKDILNKEVVEVNSYHKQKVLNSYYFKVVGMSDDGIIEAIESNNNIFQIGLQWHPEKMIDYDNNSKLIFDYFINS